MVGISSLTEANSDTKSYSRYIRRPHLFTAAKNHDYSGSSTGIILHRINLDCITKIFFTCQLDQTCHICPQISPSWCQCSVYLHAKFNLSSFSGIKMYIQHTCLRFSWKRIAEMKERKIHLENNIIQWFNVTYVLCRRSLSLSLSLPLWSLRQSTMFNYLLVAIAVLNEPLRLSQGG